MEDYKQSAFYYIRLLAKWKIQFIIVTVIAIAASAVFSSEWFIKPRYKSSAVLYPANVEPYSEESTTEQILQVLQSTDIRDAVIKKFDLAHHYGVDTTKKEGHAALIGMYQTFVSISKTQYESVMIEVTDTDPKTAAAMVSEIIARLNVKIRSMHREKTLEVAALLSGHMSFVQHQMDSLNSNMQELRVKYHILDYKEQVQEATKGYMKALVSGKGVKDIDDLLRNLEEKGGDYYRMAVIYDGLLQDYNKVHNDYNNAMKEVSKDFTFSNVVSSPVPSDKKSYPVRWLIVLISVVSADALLFVLIILGDFRRREKEKGNL